MKNIIKTFFSVFIILILIALIAFIGLIVYLTFSSNREISEVVYQSANNTVTIEDESVIERKSNNKDMGKLIAEIFDTEKKEVIEYSDTNSIGKFYYEQLNENQKILYNGLQESKDNNSLISGNHSIEFGEKFSGLLKLENGVNILQADYQTAVEAFTHDNPDLFYLDVSKLYLNIETTKKMWNIKYNVYIAPEEGKKYFDENFTNDQEVREAKLRIESVRSSVLNKLGKDTFKNIKIIHDYLINTLEYDQNYTSRSTYTIYGALIENKCVCDGYARAFKYLANAAGIECELIQGTATNSSGKTENHAWNAVKLNGKWYYIDVTWDDPVILGRGIGLNKYYYQYFLKGTKTFEENHVENGVFSENGKTFVFPTISSTDY